MRKATFTRGCFISISLMLLFISDRTATTSTRLQAEGLRKLNKPEIINIQSDDGEVIDCVDIYKQPAFDHPLLKNHTIEMRPSFIPNMKMEGNFSSDAIVEEAWLKNVSCPQGTIPILKITNKANVGEPRNCRVEIAGANAYEDGVYYGVRAQINVWNLLVRIDEWSLNSVAAINEQNSVESGWGVSPVLFGDSKARFYTRWRNGDKGCYNLGCPGFVQVSRNIVVGSYITPISTYGGRQYVIQPIIYKDDVQGKWWLLLKDEVIGYWPIGLFSSLKYASKVEWLGRVCDTQSGGYHTVTEMGSGHFPYEGFRKSSYFESMGVIHRGSSDFDAPAYEGITSYKSCYNWAQKDRSGHVAGIFYGGPGGKCCDERCG